MTNLKLCKHCEASFIPCQQEFFCCNGCDVAYHVIQEMQLTEYYELQSAYGNKKNPNVKPEKTEITDFSALVVNENGQNSIELLVDGIYCGACVWLIESALLKQLNILRARLNMTTKRLIIAWRGAENEVNDYIAILASLGYTSVPYRADIQHKLSMKEQKELLFSAVIALFGSMQIMMLSLVIWFFNSDIAAQSYTRNFLHYMISLIALPCIVFSSLHFFKHAYRAVKGMRGSMDIPISIGIILTTGVSMYETFCIGQYTFYDSALMLIAVLSVGRYFDVRVRNQAKKEAFEILMREPALAVVIDEAGYVTKNISDVKIGDVVLVASGAKMPVDGVIIEGVSTADFSLITGESQPEPIAVGDKVFAGAINLDAIIKVKVLQVGHATELGAMIELIEEAVRAKGKFVELAQRFASWYTAVTLFLACVTFLLWYWLYNISARQAILNSVGVLLVTCPCALGIAVPMAQIMSVSRLLKSRIFVKQADALERFCSIDVLVVDKTGTLTIGKPVLLNYNEIDFKYMDLIAYVAAHSKHPLCQAIAKAHAAVQHLDIEVTEEKGLGITGKGNGVFCVMGKLEYVVSKGCQIDVAKESDASNTTQEVWCYIKDNSQEYKFRMQFQDQLRKDAKQILLDIMKLGIRVIILSGDKEAVVKSIAQQLGVSEAYGNVMPQEKYNFIRQLQKQGYKVAMAGDGLNDSAALISADASIAPSSSIDISQNKADVVFSGNSLVPLFSIITSARWQQRIIKQNIAMSVIYNLIFIPIAIQGLLTPQLAALGMSVSSIAVVLNSMRKKLL